jgi:hypothetical protein
LCQRGIRDGQTPAITQLEQVLQAKIKGSDFGKSGSGNQAAKSQQAPQFSSNPLDFGKDVGMAWSYIAGFTQNLVWEILFAIYLLCLLLCKVIILLMQFVQKVVVIGFKLYTPIAVAEYAHRSLKSKAVAFFLTFVGVLSWPVGWSLVNTVTLGIFKSLPAPQSQDFATLIIGIVLAIPVLLWVLIGHVAAPIFVQKVVTRGGAVIQGFAGTMVSAVGASSMAIYSGGLGASAAMNVKRDPLITLRFREGENPSLSRWVHMRGIRTNPARIGETRFLAGRKGKRKLRRDCRVLVQVSWVPVQR